MTFLVQHIRSGEFARRPQPLDLSPGQLAVNYNTDSTGLFFRTDNGELVKVGPVHVGSDAPSQINYTERSIGELWLDTTDVQGPSLKVWTPNGWSTVNVIDGSITTDKIADGAVTVQKFTLNNSLFPTADDQFDLGTSVNRMSAIYATTVNVEGTIRPGTDLGASLGTPTLRFSDVYTGDLHLRNDRGDWTLIEEEDFIKIRNNKTGKHYRMTMEAID